MSIRRHAVEHPRNLLGQALVLAPRRGDLGYFVGGRDLAGQEKVEQPLGKRRIIALGLGQQPLNIGDVVAAETDACQRTTANGTWMVEPPGDMARTFWYAAAAWSQFDCDCSSVPRKYWA